MSVHDASALSAQGSLRGTPLPGPDLSIFYQSPSSQDHNSLPLPEQGWAPHVDEPADPYDPDRMIPAERQACIDWLSKDYAREDREEQEFYEKIDRANREAVQEEMEEWELAQERPHPKLLTPPSSPPRIKNRSSGAMRNTQSPPYSSRNSQSSKPPADQEQELGSNEELTSAAIQQPQRQSLQAPLTPRTGGAREQRGIHKRRHPLAEATESLSPPHTKKKNSGATRNTQAPPSSSRICKASKPPSQATELRQARRNARREASRRRPATRSMHANLIALHPHNRRQVTVLGQGSDNVSMGFTEYDRIKCRRLGPAGV